MSTKESGHSLAPEIDEKVPAPRADAIRTGSVSEKILEHSHDADEALKAFQGHEGEVIEIDEATNKRLLRRIDWNLMPVMCIVYGLNYLDKTALSYASIMGLKTDLNLVRDDYQCKKTSWPSSLPHANAVQFRAGLNVLFWLLSVGVPNEPTTPMASHWQVQRDLHHYLGPSSRLLRCGEQLCRCCGH